MRYDIRIERRSREVEISRQENPTSGLESYLVKLHIQNRQKQCAISILERRPDRLVISIENKIYAVTQLKRSPVSVSFVANGRLQVAQIRTKFDEESAALAPPISEYVTATLPAKVVKVSVKQGDSLKQGAELVVLEAMKMDLQVVAPKDCRVKEIYVREGESVEKGKRLVWLEFL